LGKIASGKRLKFGGSTPENAAAAPPTRGTGFRVPKVLDVGLFRSSNRGAVEKWGSCPGTKKVQGEGMVTQVTSGNCKCQPDREGTHWKGSKLPRRRVPWLSNRILP